MQQVIVDFGALNVFATRIPLRIHGYGLMLVLGFLLAVYLARWRARRAGENPDLITHCGLLALVGGILGARLAFVIKYWDGFAGKGVGEILNVTSGGLIYYGGLVLATVLVVAYLLAKRVPIRRHLDILAVSLMVGLAFGRVGCLLNGCCFGGRCKCRWALSMTFPMFSRPLIKLDGRDNPFSQGTEGASPPYMDQFQSGLVHPDDRFVLPGGGPQRRLLPPRYLHGKLGNDQLAALFEPQAAAQEKFSALAGGPDGRIGEEQWNKHLAGGNGLLLGSENWKVAERFDRDGDGALAGPEREEANRWLQADLFELADRHRSLPVKPAQALGIANALIIAGILLAFSRLRSREGRTFALLLVLYPITRFVLESIRGDNAHSIWDFVLTHNQYTSLAMAAAGVIMWMALRRMPASAGPTWAQRLGVSHLDSTRPGAGRPRRRPGRAKRRRS